MCAATHSDIGIWKAFICCLESRSTSTSIICWEYYLKLDCIVWLPSHTMTWKKSRSQVLNNERLCWVVKSVCYRLLRVLSSWHSWCFASELFYLFTALIRLVTSSSLNSSSGGLYYPDCSLLLKLNESIVIVSWETSPAGYAFMMRWSIISAMFLKWWYLWNINIRKLNLMI